MHAVQATQPQARIVGRYAIYGEIASGGMATVHFGRLVGQVGFSRTVAIKRLHPQFAKDPDFVSMFVDEARLAARIQHPNVVPTVDIVCIDDELFLVMEYVQGEALSKLIRAARRAEQMVPPRIATSIVAGALHGLHAAHEAKSERGEPLNIVHRDVSPQNILVGSDGVSRVLDFGVAKAAMRVTSTRDGQMKGKIAYMAPEQMRGRGVDRRTDLFAAGVVLWEALTGRRLFDGNDPGEILTKLLEEPIALPSSVEPSVPPVLDELVMRSLERDITRRYATAREFAIALEHSGYVALPREVGEWVAAIGGDSLARRAEQVAEIESISSHVNLVGLPGGSGPPSLPAGEVPSQVTNASQVRHSQISHPSAASQGYGPPSQVSLPAGMDAGAKRRSLTAALVGVVAALTIALCVLVIVWIRRPAEPDLLLPPTEPVQTAASPSEPVPARAPSPPPDPTPEVPTVVLAPEPPAPVATVKSVRAPRGASKPTSTTAVAPPTQAPPPKPAANCADPTFVDKDGVKRIKPECR